MTERVTCVRVHDVAPKHTSAATTANAVMRWRRLARDGASGVAEGSKADRAVFRDCLRVKLKESRSVDQLYRLLGPLASYFSRRRCNHTTSQGSKYPTAEPEALRLLAPQRGLFATVESKSKNNSKNAECKTRYYSRNCQTSTASPAEAGGLPIGLELRLERPLWEIIKLPAKPC